MGRDELLAEVLSKQTGRDPVEGHSHADNSWVGLVQQWGQVYIPVMNYTLMILCLAAVGGFKTSAALGNAYGAQALQQG